MESTSVAFVLVTGAEYWQRNGVMNLCDYTLFRSHDSFCFKGISAVACYSSQPLTIPTQAADEFSADGDREGARAQ